MDKERETETETHIERQTDRQSDIDTQRQKQSWEWKRRFIMCFVKYLGKGHCVLTFQDSNLPISL